MSCKDRPAERKSQPQTAVAVCNLILPGKEHFKDLRFILLRDTRAIIGYIYHDITVFCIRRNIDPGAFLRVFDGVVHQIDNDLHDKPCVHVGKKNFIRISRCDDMLLAFSADMPQRFLDHLIHELRRDLKIHPPILNAGDRKQIFHQTDQPLCIIKNIRTDLCPCFCIQRFRIGEQITCIA